MRLPELLSGTPGSSPTRRLRKLLQREGMTVSVGAHDVFTALLAERAGFETVFLGGFGAAASLLGLPDYGLITLSEMADQVRRMAARVAVPVIADGDDGHGDLHNALRTLQLFEAAGAAGMLIEDQVHPKKCGHFSEKRVVPVNEAVRKLEAVSRARRDPEFVLIGRTDARAVEGLDSAIDRARRFHDAGADVVFIEAPESRGELERIAAEVKAPLLVNLLTGGRTPLLKKSELAEMGYQIAVYPIESLMVQARALQKLFRTLRAEEDLSALAGDLASFGELKELLGLDDFEKLGRAP